MERRRVRPQESQGNDDVERPQRAGRIAPRTHRRGRGSGPFGLRGKRYRHGHHTLVAASRSLVEGAAPVESFADRRAGANPRHPCLPPCPALQPWSEVWHGQGARNAARRGLMGAVPTGAGPIRMAGATRRVRLAVIRGQAATQYCSERRLIRRHRSAPACHQPAPAHHRSGANMTQSLRICKLHLFWRGVGIGWGSGEVG